MRGFLITRYLYDSYLRGVPEPNLEKMEAPTDPIPADFQPHRLIDGMVAAITGIHSRYVIHRNIRPESFRLQRGAQREAQRGLQKDEAPRVVLTDYSHAIMTKHSNKFLSNLYEEFQSPTWGPPCPDFINQENGEMMEDQASYGYEYDMWCLGLCVIRILYPDVKLPEYTCQDDWEKFITGVIAQECKVQYAATYRPMLYHLLQWDRKKRLISYAARNMCDIKSADVNAYRDDGLTQDSIRVSQISRVLEQCENKGLKKYMHLYVSDFAKFYSTMMDYEQSKDFTPPGTRYQIWGTRLGIFGRVLLKTAADTLQMPNWYVPGEEMIYNVKLMMEFGYRIFSRMVMCYYMVYIMFNEEQPSDLYSYKTWGDVLQSFESHYLKLGSEALSMRKVIDEKDAKDRAAEEKKQEDIKKSMDDEIALQSRYVEATRNQ